MGHLEAHEPNGVQVIEEQLQTYLHDDDEGAAHPVAHRTLPLLFGQAHYQDREDEGVISAQQPFKTDEHGNS
jgi:hypothetical protein